ncbi:hypothetical protein HanXRQr2_Chr10g0431111 [Helianthus annuus]|uniref:Uncharacterized protein n=1 Tax=Helianthus annuus TaxID=4232 RepID=A0A9K3HWL7_HELAN|nr:hypothetical protein HanXRQr2_Chr10g0431111 [Helianthus annuus]
MHNVQVLRHKKTQTIYPLHGSSSTLHFFNFFTRIYIWTVHLTSHGSPIAFSLIPHTSHKTTSDLLSLSLSAI